MSDPLRPARPGRVSPLVSNVGTINTVLDAVRRFRDTKQGNGGTPPLEEDPLRPSLRVLVKNSTGGSIVTRSVLALGDPLPSTSTPTDYPHEVRIRPAFVGDAPASSSDPFCITEGIIGSGEIGRGIVQGVAVCNVNVTDTSHGYARPAVGVTATLASDWTGPARILWRESGTGSKRAIVLLGDVTGTGSLGVNSWKLAVRCASTANVTVSSPGSSIDGVTLSSSDSAQNRRVLLKNQTTASENRIYQWNGASSGMTPTEDADAVDELVGAVVWVSEGTTNADTIWACTTDKTITPGSTSTTWVQIYPDTTPYYRLAKVSVSTSWDNHSVVIETLSGGSIADVSPTVTVTNCISTTGLALPVGCIVSLRQDVYGNQWITPAAYASHTMPGLVSEVAQTIHGNKTFDNFVVVNNEQGTGYCFKVYDLTTDALVMWSDTSYSDMTDRTLTLWSTGNPGDFKLYGGQFFYGMTTSSMQDSHLFLCTDFATSWTSGETVMAYKDSGSTTRRLNSTMRNQWYIQLASASDGSDAVWALVTIEDGHWVAAAPTPGSA